ARRSAHHLRSAHRRAAALTARSSLKSQYADRNRKRLRIYGNGMQELDDPGRIPRDLDRTPRGYARGGDRHQNQFLIFRDRVRPDVVWIDQTEQWQGAARCVDRILRGEKPGELQAPTKFELVTARALGLTIPPALPPARRRGDRMKRRVHRAVLLGLI